MLRLKNNKSILVIFLLSLFTLIISFFELLIINSNSAKADETANSDIALSIDSALTMSLTNCDSTYSSLIKLDVEPTPAGTFKSNCQTVDVQTNHPGYTLTVRSSSTDLTYQNPTSISPLPTIPSTLNTIGGTPAPSILSNNTWGFAVEGNTSQGFDSAYAIDNANNKYALLSSSEDTNIYFTDQFPIPVTTHKFFYATKLTPATTAGTYTTTITYTAIGEPVPEAPCMGEVVICIKVTEPGTITVENIWQDPITYIINGSDPITITSGARSSDLNVSVGDVIEVEEGIDNVTFRSWRSLQPMGGFVANTTSTSAARVSITKMPAMNRFTIDDTGTTAGNKFFSYFAGSFNNALYPTTISSLPAGSFDISNITSTDNYFFSGFNNNGFLTSLPVGSFDTSNITSTGVYFFSGFNNGGSLTSLPAGSFDISNIESAEGFFFYQFNQSGKSLTSLPAGSFDTSNITSVVGEYFLNFFNHGGSLTSLPAGSFDTSNITSVVGDYFLTNFNGGSTSTAGKLQAGTGAATDVIITNTHSSSVMFWQRPFGEPEEEAFSTNVRVGDTIIFLAN